MLSAEYPSNLIVLKNFNFLYIINMCEIKFILISRRQIKK